MPSRPPRWLLVSLLLSTLACATFNTGSPTPNAPPTTASRATRTPRPTATVGPSPTPLPAFAMDFATADQIQAAMRPEYAQEVAQFPDLTHYAIEVTVTFERNSATLTGRSRIRYTNTQDFELTELYLMLWPNEPSQYLGSMTLDEVQVAGEPRDFVLEEDDKAARIALAEPLQPGASVELETAFTVEADGGVEDRGARFGLTYDVLLAPTFYPLIPRIVAGQWQITLPANSGDTTNSDSAFYVWQVTAPQDMHIIGSGTVVAESSDDTTQTQVLVTGPMRDLALVVGELEHTQKVEDGITYNVYLLPQNAEYADEMMDFSVRQVATLSERVGPYPFAELDVIDTPGTYGGVEYPGLIFIGVVGDDLFFELATVHEVGHQWFYSLIGDDQLEEPWLDEAAASYTEVLYLEQHPSSITAEELLESSRSTLIFAEDPDLPIGLPVAEYSEGDYGIIVYQKGAMFFAALREELGDEVFFEFLQTYYARHRYGFATTAAFQATAEETCACELDELFDLWVHKGGPIE